MLNDITLVLAKLIIYHIPKNAIFEIVQVGVAKQYRAKNKNTKRCPHLSVGRLFGMFPKTTNLRFGSFGNPDLFISGLMQERSYTATVVGYRFGFNDYENEPDVAGQGAVIDFGARIFDSRLGRFFSTDPIVYPYWSPYQYDANSPISMKDVLGMRVDPPKKSDFPKNPRNGNEYSIEDVDGSKLSYKYNSEASLWELLETVESPVTVRAKGLTIEEKAARGHCVYPQPLVGPLPKDKDGSSFILPDTEVDENGQILRTTGFTGTAALGALGVSIEFGIASDYDYNYAQPYFTLEHANGFDLSYGVVANQHQKIIGGREITLADLEGTGSSINYGLLTFDLSRGGGFTDKGFDNQTTIYLGQGNHDLYKTRGLGASDGLHVGFTWNIGKTWIFNTKLWGE